MGPGGAAVRWLGMTIVILGEALCLGRYRVAEEFWSRAYYISPDVLAWAGLALIAAGVILWCWPAKLRA